MEQNIHIEGMTCGSCVAKLKTLFEGQKQVQTAQVSLEKKTVRLRVDETLSDAFIQSLLLPFPKYQLKTTSPLEAKQTKLQTFKPLILVFLFLLLVSILAAIQPAGFSFMDWMNYFMAGFFLAFSFFKCLDIPSFASSFQMYDLLAKRSRLYALSYPFIELSLGVAYLIQFEPKITNWVALLVMGFGTLGVVKSVRSKTKIRCACLGSLWDLPMTTVTVVENTTMVLMAGYSLFLLG